MNDNTGTHDAPLYDATCRDLLVDPLADVVAEAETVAAEANR